jgi:hypothetical protein
MKTSTIEIRSANSYRIHLPVQGLAPFFLLLVADALLPSVYKNGEHKLNGGAAMKFHALARLGTAFLFVFAAGCTTYYRINDHASGRVYYTTDYDRADSGAIIFEDAKNRSKITLQSSEVREVSRADFEAGIKN